MKIVEDLPKSTSTRPFTKHWQEVADLCLANPGKWVHVTVPGSISSARAAYGIREGQYKYLKGFEATSRDKELYVRYPVDTDEEE